MYHFGGLEEEVLLLGGLGEEGGFVLDLRGKRVEAVGEHGDGWRNELGDLAGSQEVWSVLGVCFPCGEGAECLVQVSIGAKGEDRGQAGFGRL